MCHQKNKDKTANNDVVVQVYQATKMLDFNHPDIQALIAKKGWRKLTTYQAIGAIYAFVRDDILFGYNCDDQILASQVLKNGYGQCNTKATLLMALLRALGVACRFHGFTIDNELQRGAIPSVFLRFAPKKIIHSWVEIYFQGRWLNLEGYIVDKPYLAQIQQHFSSQPQMFFGYGVATTSLVEPKIDWLGEDTYIQREGIVDDFGIFDNPEQFYQQRGGNLSGIKKLIYRYLLRFIINANVKIIRKYGVIF